MRILALTEKKNNQGAMTNGVRAAMAIGRLGHRIEVIEHRFLDLDSLRAADLIVAFGTLLYLRHVSQAKWIAENKRKDAPFVLWYFDACNPVFKHSQHKVGAMLKIAPLLDHLFMTDHSYPWEKHTRKFTQLMQGIDPGDFNHQVAPYDGRRFDVMFTGTHLAAFEERESMLRLIAKKHCLKWIGANPSQRVVGYSFFQAYQSAKVAFVPPPPACVNNHYWSNRIYLAAGTGTPCVVGCTPGIEEHYIQNQEVLYFGNAVDMMGMIESLLEDPKLRERIGSAGRARTLRDHTYDARVKTLLEAVNGSV